MLLTVICCVYTLTAYAQDAPDIGTSVDTVQSGGSDAAVDTLTDIVESDDDSLDYFDSDDVRKPKHSAVSKSDGFDDFDSDADLEIDDVSPDADSPQKLENIRRGYERRRQVKLALIMMILIIAALGTSQSFNPR